MSGKAKDHSNDLPISPQAKIGSTRFIESMSFILLIFRLRPLFESKYYRKHRLIRETDQIRSNRHISKEQLVHKKEHRHMYFDNFSLTSSRKSANAMQNNLRTTYQYTRKEMRNFARDEVQTALVPPIPLQPAMPNPNLPVIPGVRQDRNLHGGVCGWNQNTLTGVRLPPGVFAPLLPHTRPIIAVGNAGFSWRKPHAAVNNAVRLFLLKLLLVLIPRNCDSRCCHYTHSGTRHLPQVRIVSSIPQAATSSPSHAGISSD